MTSNSFLSGDRRLRFQEEACLAARSAGAVCTACETACPAEALKLTDTPALVSACLGCGRCAAACPTGALQVEGFDGDLPLPEGNSPTRVDCWMVPQDLSSHGTLRVPCLGGISPGRLLACVEARQQPIELIDRGWCEGCTAHGPRPGHAVAHTLATVSAWLSTAGVPAHRQPRLVSEPLPVGLRPSELPRALTEAPISRRGFLRHLVARASEPLQAPPVTYITASALRQSTHRQPEQDLRRKVLILLTTRWGGSVHPRVMPSIQVDSTCRGHGVCAASCPTGALSLTEHAGSAVLAFEAAHCVACGLCERVCAQAAIHLDTTHAGASGYLLLARHAIKTCTDCGTFHSASGTLCPRCDAGQSMALQLFSTSGPSRTVFPSSPEALHHE